MAGVAILRGKAPDWMASNGDGYGDGDGYGYGYGYGYGGYGDGYGDGYGEGDGDGYGYGYGYGYGGYGDGYGDGYGYGYGEGPYWQAVLPHFLKKLPQAAQDRAAVLEKQGAKLAYWRSHSDGSPSNGGSAAPAQAGAVQKVSGPLKICTHRALHATMIPPRWKGEKVWIVALVGEIQGDDEKYGALEREIIGECLTV